jgi:hypothetical protein
MNHSQLEIKSCSADALYFIDEDYVQADIEAFCGSFPPLDISALENLGACLVNSSFIDNLILAIIPTDDEFNPMLAGYLCVDFSGSSRRAWVESTENLNVVHTAQMLAGGDKRVEVLRVRENSLRGALYRALPLEDLSIGFQVRMYRWPNVYNFKFWDHFTNKEQFGLGICRDLY